MVPLPLAGQVLDLARNRSQVMRAGAITVPMTSQTLKYARLTADPTSSWHTENGAISDSSATMDAVTFTARTLTCLVKFSAEVFDDAVNFDAVVTHGIAASIGLELDRVALYGSGTAPEPRGVKNTSGITTTILGGGANGTPLTTTFGFGFLLDAAQTLRAANYEPSATILAPRTETSIGKMVDSTGQPLRAPDAVAAIPRLQTNQIGTALTVGTSADTSDAFTGAWDHLLVGMRTGLQIQFLNERYADSLTWAFLAWVRMDVQLARAGAFNVITGIRP